jgi:cytochrome c oxidase subunit III
MYEPPFFSNEPEPLRERSWNLSNAQLGLILFCSSLAVLFAASLVAYVVTRLASPNWRAGMPGLPLGLAGSSLLLIALSVSMHWALRAVRKNRLELLHKALSLSLILAIAFVAGQALNWAGMARAALAVEAPTLYPFTFFLLTGLHALHVIGGIVPTAVLLARASRREYSSSRHEGIQLCTQYWDFLGAVWVVLLVTLWIFT